MLLHGNCITFFVSLRTVVLIHHKLKCTSCIYCYKFISIMADSDKRLIGDGSQNISNRNPYNPNILPAAPESLRPETQTHYISANDALVQKKKPTSFQITSVTVQGSRLSTDGGEDSADDLDESHTEDISSDILDCSRTTDIDNDQLSEDNSNANNDDLPNLGLPIPIKCISDCQIKRDVQVSKIPSEPIVNVKSNVEVKINTTSNLITSEPPSVKTPTLPDQWQHRFKVVKIISSEPFKRGRWLCMDFMDPPNVQSSEVKPETSESLAGSSALLEGSDRTTSSGLPVNRLAHIYEISPNESYPGSVSVTVSPQQVHQPLYGIYLPINNQMPDMATMPAMFAQNPRLDTIQKPKSTVALQQSTSFTTQPMQQQSFVASTMQQPQSFISNNQAFEDKPMTQQNFTSQPQQNFTSQPQQTFTPQPQQTFTPQPQQTFMPQPQQTFTPQPQQTFTPQPQQTFTPQPQQTFTPQPPQSQAMPSVPVQQQQLTMQHTTSSNSLTGQTQAQTTVGAGTVPEGMLMQSSQHQVVSSTATVPMVMSQPQVMQDVHIPTSHSQATQKTSQVLPNHSSQNLHLQSMTPVSSAPTVISSASQANLAQMPSSCLQNQPSQLHQVSSVPLNIAPVAPLQTSIAPSIPDISSTNAHLVANQEVYNVPSQVSQNHIDTSDHGTPPAVISQSLVEVLPDALVTKTITIITNSEESTESAPSGSNTVAIDNKIEQAMDLVKSHLMFAVREEVDVLKEKITELMERISQLEYENSFLKANASHETLEQLNQSQQLQQQQTQNAAVSINPLQPLQQSIQNQQPTS